MIRCTLDGGNVVAGSARHKPSRPNIFRMQVRKMRMTALKYLALENQAAVLPSIHSMNIRESDRKQRMARPAWLGLTPKPDRYPTLVETYSNIVSLKQNPKVHV